MSRSDKPSKPPPKPFLADDSELDQWDSMFDALHTPEEGGGAAGPGPAPMQWPAPAQAEPSAKLEAPPRAPEAAAPRPGSIGELALDEQMTLDRAATSDPVEPAAIEDETDFSDLGARGDPAALGDMLGALPPFADDDAEPETRISTGQPAAEEDEVYTSAARGKSRTAPPALPLPPPTRRTAAIIRRTPAAGVPGSRTTGSVERQRPTPSQGYDTAGDPDASPFSEATKIADLDEMEARAQEMRPDARSKAPTAPPPMFQTYEPAQPVEDDYEIEIAASEPDEDAHAPASESSPALPAIPAAAPRRTVANVIRRSMPMPSVAPPARPSTVLPVPRPPTDEPDIANTEDDFSDVAAAVGASDDLAMPGPSDRASGPQSIVEVRVESLADAPLDELDRAASAGDPYQALDAALDIPDDEADDDPARTRADSPRAREAIDPAKTLVRPPSIVDLYPRVKMPTSVPPLGIAAADLPDEPLPGETLQGMQVAPTEHVRPAPRVMTSAGFEDVPEIEPTIDLEAIQLPEQLQPLPTSELDEDAAAALLVYERELATVDETATSAALRVEAGRLSERLGDTDRARSHYDAALLADPRATAALRGLRRIARASADLVEATRQLDAEVAVAGALERRPLGHYRLDLLLASGEHDLARVAAGEILDNAPSDLRAVLAQLELAFLDGRADEFGHALEQLAHAVADTELRAAVQSARGLLAAQHDDRAGAATWFAAAAESDPASLGARVGAVRQAAAAGDGVAAGRAYVELARQLADSDPTTCAALALRAQQWAGSGEVATAAAQLATAAMPGDPLVARVAAETAAPAGGDLAAAAFAQWAASGATEAERAYAAARAAELDAAHAGELWGTVLQLDPGDDYAAAQLRTAHVVAEQAQLAIEVDLAVAADVERDRARLRAAFGLIAQGQLDAAIQLLEIGRTERSGSLALAEALAEAYAAAGRWSDRATLLAELAREPGDQLDREVAQLRSALAWEEAAGGAAERGDNDEMARTSGAALAAWEGLLERGGSPAGHAAAITLATRLGDRDVLVDALARAQQAERSPWAAASIALRRARFVADDPARADGILRDAAASGIDDPRRTLALVLSAARRRELGDAATALEERAGHVGEGEAAALRLRAAQLALDTGDAQRATALLGKVGATLPSLTIVGDLLQAARRRAGDRGGSGPHVRPGDLRGAQAGDAFARLVRDADLAASQNDGSSALALYQRALELRPGDPLAAVPLVRVATQLREPAPIAALALAQLRAAEGGGDAAAKAEAYELLARIDKELRDDAPSAQIALESASQAEPSRVDLMYRLEREYTVGDQLGELLRLRRAELDQIPLELGADRAAMIMDTAVLAERDKRPDAELTELYRAALVCDPRRRLALLRLESLVRRAGASAELAQLEDQVAGYFENDARTQAAFYTRAGETLAELGLIDAAVQKFGKAEAVQPGHVPALEGWRQAALKGQLWIDVAEAATRQAAAASDGEVRGQLHHFAGVALMDKALAGEQAMTAFQRALEADPGHRDAFLRLRILLDEDARHDELAILLANRLEHEKDPAARVEIHRALAKLYRDFLDQRDAAKRHYREILAADPNDLGAHAAIADISWEQGAWQDAADSLISRAKLERDPGTLKTLCFRLGLIYADRLVDVPMALKAFQRALTYQPDDENTLVRLADLATGAGEWKLALGACERLVKNEQDPEKRAQHLSRVAKIFKQGFGDAKRAERALNLALDGAPTSDEALDQLVQFYREAGDMTSVRVHLNRVAGTMRVRLQADHGPGPRDGIAYRVIARAMAARNAAGVDGSLHIARAAAELAELFGAAGDPERVLLSEPTRVELAPLVRPDADEVLFPRGVSPELRQIFQLLGDRLAKHVGIDLRAYGVGRGDRLRAKDSSVAANAQDVATGLGFGEIDVYVSTRQPFAMVAEPTSPVSLVIGQSIAQAQDSGRSVRFAAGTALKLAQASLAIPARLPADDLGVLVVALLRQFQPEFPTTGLDEAAVTAQAQKLRRLIPSGLMNELKPYALAIDASAFDHVGLARDVKLAGLRAGVVAAGSLVTGLRLLAAQADTDVPSFLADPVAQGLVAFALGEDHAALAR
jgi:tetratricopeptide (TPR) repeat protein